MEKYAIRAEKLCCQIGKSFLVNEVNWSVRPGEHWVLFGMNGSGKTTLLSMVAGYKRITSGTLNVLGQTYTNDTILDIRRKIGFVSASFFDSFYKKEAVLDIVLSGLSGALGIAMDISEVQVRTAKKLLKAMDLARKINYPYYWLSKGERQSVLIARALLSDPEMLLLDEPCSGLDLYARERLQNTVRELCDHTDMTIVYVTHYTDEILDEFDHALLLKKGHSWQSGKTQELFTVENLSRFLGYEVFASENKKYSLSVRAKCEESLYQIIGGAQI